VGCAASVDQVDPLGDDSESDPARKAHIDRLHAELRWLPCSPRCANWLRYGIQPDRPRPGRCPSKAHDREHLGIGGRRVLVSRDWSGKTLSEHRADRSAVVKHCSPPGMAAPDLERMATDVLSPDGLPRYVDRRTPQPHHLHPDAPTAVAERQRWRAQYGQAKTRTAVETVDSLSTTGPPSGGGRPSPSVAHSSASPDNPPNLGPQDRQSRVSAANPQDRSEATALDGRTGGPTFTTRGGRAPRPRAKPMPTAGGQETIMTTTRIQPDVPALLHRVDEAAVALRLSRSVLYELIRTGQLAPSRRVSVAWFRSPRSLSTSTLLTVRRDQASRLRRRRVVLE
jgi:hypothetical protein